MTWGTFTSALLENYAYDIDVNSSEKKTKKKQGGRCF